MLRSLFFLILLPLVLLACGTEPTPASAPTVTADPAGLTAQPWFDPEAPATVLVFTRDDCPISNRYAPELARLHDELSPRGVRFLRVYPDPDATPETMTAHGERFSYPFDAVADPDHRLVAAVGATITPEAAVLDAAGELVYRGRIDDRWVSFGQARQEPTRRDLEDAVESLLAGDPPAGPVTTEAVGCYLEDLR
jgi:hypothetical protein